jgi:hypothetical protein
MTGEPTGYRKKWMELAEDRVQWRAFVLTVLNLWALLPEVVS